MFTSKYSRSSIVLVVLMWLLLIGISAEAQMKMHVINVGQAEAIILEFENHAVLVDAGSHRSEDGEHFLTYLEKFFDDRPDLNQTFHSVVVSHPHPDHTRNLKKVFDLYTVEHFVDGGYAPNGDVTGVRSILADEGAVHHKAYARSVKRANFMKAWRKELKDGSNVDVRFLSAGRKCNNQNNASLVMRVEYKGRTFLLLGDAEESDKKGASLGCGGLLFRLLSETAAFPALLDVDVYKVAHHGARNGTIDQLLAKAKPMYAVISAGDNTQDQQSGSFSAWDHGHPNADSVGRLIARVSKTRPTTTVTVMDGQESDVITRTLTKAIYSTGWDGDIVFTVTAAGVLSAPELIN